jgi:hypothetical protein
MKRDFLSELIGNTNRAKILRTLIFNENERLTPKVAAKRATVTATAAEEELMALEKIGVVKRGQAVSRDKSKASDKQPVWFLNPNFEYLRALSAFVREISPMRYDEIVGVLKPSGKLSMVVLSGSFMGDPTRPADILVAADRLNVNRLENAVKVLEPMFGTEIRYAAFSTPEFRYRLTVQDRLIRDTLDYPHLVLLDRPGLL